MFDACVFDLYGTLVNVSTNEGDDFLWRKMAQHYCAHGAHWTKEALRDRYFALIRLLEEEAGEQNAEIVIDPVFAALFEEKGVPVKEGMVRHAAQRFRILSTDVLALYPGAWDLLDSLRAAGKRVILLSNAQRAFTQHELELLSLDKRFDAIFLSSDYGVKKPDRRFFERMIRDTGIDPARAVMVGNDARCDILAAQAVGMAGVYMHSECSPNESAPACAFALNHVDLAAVKNFLLS